MTVCLETGEVDRELLLTVCCNSPHNPETGEAEKRCRSPFKVPTTRQTVPNPHTTVKERSRGRKCCGGTYVVTLAMITLMMFAPAYGVTLWVGIETLYHLYSHKKTGLYQHPLQVFFFSEFCAYCQSKKRMDKVQRLQDRRYRNYVSNIPMGT